ncbi:unnamed protein product, partial [Rotaria sp. Silwood1]
RHLGNHISYQMTDNSYSQRRVSPAAIRLLRCRTSTDSSVSNGTSIKHHI